MKIYQENYSGILVVAVSAVFDSPLGSLETPAEIFEMLDTQFTPPISKDENTKTLVRDVLRQTGYKPTGRGKPASEYLIKAVSEKRLGKINPCVDVLNIVSLHCGFPISVVDLDLVKDQLKIKPAPPETSCVFNASGQEIKLDGLICLYDSEGPCANGVKDSQRTKTNAATTKTLSVFWGVQSLEAQVNAGVAWYAELLRKVGAAVEPVPISITDIV
jgi:DNA/RNA-binding domain of Phe-tRNA-synthetase-like protein